QATALAQRLDLRRDVLRLRVASVWRGCHLFVTSPGHCPIIGLSTARWCGEDCLNWILLPHIQTGNSGTATTAAALYGGGPRPGSQATVRITGPSAVTAIVCSLCAALLPSAVL